MNQHTSFSMDLPTSQEFAALRMREFLCTLVARSAWDKNFYTLYGDAGGRNLLEDAMRIVYGEYTDDQLRGFWKAVPEMARFEAMHQKTGFCEEDLSAYANVFYTHGAHFESAVAYNHAKDMIVVSTFNLCRGEEFLDPFKLETRGQSWLEDLGALVRGRPTTRPGASEFLDALSRFADANVPRLLLDSFSVVENGEKSRRTPRTVKPSPSQEAILSLAMDNASLHRVMSPREFEVLVAHVLSRLGLQKVELRRYTKDAGADIVALLVDGPEEEVVVVEVKHGRNGIGLAVLDRLNGVRARMCAERALLVSSSHTTRDAKRAYEAHSAHVADYTIAELMAILREAPDWWVSPSGLWTKEGPKRREHSSDNAATRRKPHGHAEGTWETA